MAKPRDVDQASWDMADRFMERAYPSGPKEFAARAIMAAKAEEREACAAALEEEAYGNPVIVRFATTMASAIRKRGEA